MPVRYTICIACFGPLLHRHHTLLNTSSASRMPREVRKRGKKHKTARHQVLRGVQVKQEREDYPNNSSEPSWIVSTREAEDVHPEAPFGYVDPDVKAYFRTVDEQIQSWQEDRTQSVDEDGDLDPNEAKRVFFVAVSLQPVSRVDCRAMFRASTIKA
jgi:hypothetical protein